MFLKSIVIPSFDEDLSFSTSKERKAWMRKKEDQRFAWMEEKVVRLPLSKEKVDELMDRFSTVKSLTEAEMKLEKLQLRRQKSQLTLLTGDGCPWRLRCDVYDGIIIYLLCLQVLHWVLVMATLTNPIG